MSIMRVLIPSVNSSANAKVLAYVNFELFDQFVGMFSGACIII